MPAETPTNGQRRQQTELPEWRFLAAVTLALLALYLPTASYHRPYHIDALTNVFTAWAMANEGTPYLDDWADSTGPEFFSQGNQLIEGRGRPISKYPPGAAILAAPGYLLFNEAPMVTGQYRAFDGVDKVVSARLPSLIPAALVAGLSTALGVASIGLLVRRRLGGRPGVATALTLGLGTTFWAVAANQLWQHGPVAMWTGLGLLAIDSRRDGWGGLALAFAVFTRPQMAVPVAVIGLGMAIRERSLRRLLVVGSISSMGLVAYVAYNMAFFGEPIPYLAAGYWVQSVSSGSMTLFDSLWRTFFDQNQGVMVWSPVALLAVPGLREAWRRADDLVRVSALAGVVYLIVQLLGNVWTGGSGFFAYRIALEPIFLAAPMLAISVVAWTAGNIVRTRILMLGLLTTGAIQLFGALVD